MCWLLNTATLQVVNYLTVLVLHIYTADTRRFVLDGKYLHLAQLHNRLLGILNKHQANILESRAVLQVYLYEAAVLLKLVSIEKLQASQQVSPIHYRQLRPGIYIHERTNQPSSLQQATSLPNVLSVEPVRSFWSDGNVILSPLIAGTLHH